MNEDKKQKFEVYLLDVFLDESGWQENERFYLGTLEVEPAVGADLDDVDILAARSAPWSPQTAGRSMLRTITETGPGGRSEP